MRQFEDKTWECMRQWCLMTTCVCVIYSDLCHSLAWQRRTEKPGQFRQDVDLDMRYRGALNRLRRLMNDIL